MKNLFDFMYDSFNPIDKLEYFLKNREKNIFEVSNHIILSMHILNICFLEYFNMKLVYVLDDSSIFEIQKHCFDYNEIEVRKGIMALDYCNLIYRFTCARKFNIDDDSIKQLRINSWGEEYVNKLYDVYPITPCQLKLYRQSKVC